MRDESPLIPSCHHLLIRLSLCLCASVVNRSEAQTTQKLIDSLSSTNVAARADAAHDLARRKDKVAIPALLKAFPREQVESIRAQIVGGVDGKLGVVFFAASGADEAAEIPLGEAEAAEQAAAASVALRAESGERGLAMAERAVERGRVLGWQCKLGSAKFGVGLEKG